MNDTIFRNWEQVVAPADTILILGDVTVHGLWGRRLARVRQAPGRKILVYGNHEITSTGLMETNGFDEVHSSLYVERQAPQKAIQPEDRPLNGTQPSQNVVLNVVLKQKHVDNPLVFNSLQAAPQKRGNNPASSSASSSSTGTCRTRAHPAE